MVRLTVKGTACGLYNVYTVTVVTTSHGITDWLWHNNIMSEVNMLYHGWAVLPWEGGYKVLVHIVQATYTTYLCSFIMVYLNCTLKACI